MRATLIELSVKPDWPLKNNFSNDPEDEPMSLTQLFLQSQHQLFHLISLGVLLLLIHQLSSLLLVVISQD